MSDETWSNKSISTTEREVYPTKFNPMSGEELYLAKLACFKSPFWLLKKGDINIYQNMTVDDNMGGGGVRQSSKMYDVIYGWSLKDNLLQMWTSEPEVNI